MRPTTAFVAVAALVLLQGCPVAARRRDLYAEMNLTSDATTKDIKRIYQKWSRMLHPDITKWPRELARDRMMEVTEAYEVLSDEERREKYDSTGKMDIGTEANTDQLRARLFDGTHDAFMFKSIEQFNAARDNKEVWIILFWSKNYPECLEAAAIWNKFATRMKGIVSVGTVQCDNMMQLCRSLRMRTLPSVFFVKNGQALPYTGKLEQQSLVDFSASNLLVHADETIKDFRPGMFAYSAPIKSSLQHFTPGSVLASGAYFSPQVRRSTLAVPEVWELLTFEYTDCMDCRIELRMAVESLHKYSPTKIKVIRTDCSLPENANFCKLAPPQGHAWRVAHGRRTTHYAPSSGEAGWTRIKSSPLALEFFTYTGRTWNARQILNFVFELQKSKIIHLSAKAFHDVALKEATAWAVMFTASEGCPKCVTYKADWEIMSRITQGYVSPKGTKLKVASLDCTKHVAYCSSLGLGGQLPALRMWRGGVLQKQEDPHKLGLMDPNSMLQECQREMEPLTLVQLTQSLYNREVLNKTGEATPPGNWFIMYNAGSWCPPCMQMKQPWKDMTRLLEESSVGGKIKLGQVDCDNNGDFCKAVNVGSYPTMHLMLEGRRTPLPYSGDRSAQAMADWVEEQIDNYVVVLRSGSLAAVTKSRKQPAIVSFSAGSWCPPCTALKKKWKLLAQQLYPMKVATINCDEDREGCQKYGIDGYPTIILYPNGPDNRRKHKIYEGGPDIETIRKWVISSVGDNFKFEPKA
eukprot:TRINITY_DN59121_c0_g1_i1.p1 TRINITY_DN59121_c0_g1~~TRINITY_DN59121_c0_g1_i1.p1  ORF type:complete len:749 (+),score=324.04 TRINITY_DN59121_c0_g1_i1:124-2370(+)